MLLRVIGSAVLGLLALCAILANRKFTFRFARMAAVKRAHGFQGLLPRLCGYRRERALRGLSGRGALSFREGHGSDFLGRADGLIARELGREQ